MKAAVIAKSPFLMLPAILPQGRSGVIRCVGLDAGGLAHADEGRRFAPPGRCVQYLAPALSGLGGSKMNVLKMDPLGQEK